MTKRTVFLKIGGSLITDKTKAFTAKKDIINKLSTQIKSALDEDPNLQLVIGNGAGSFGHYAVVKHDVKGGISSSSEDRIGFAEVQKAVADLNRTIVNSLLKVGVPAVSFQPSSAVVGSNGKISHFCAIPLIEMLKKGITPVMYGDIIIDSERGSMIASTEMLIGAAITEFGKNDIHVDRVIQNGIVRGVLDKEDKIIDLIKRDNFVDIKKLVRKTNGYDVTGGMMHKIEESLDLADQGISTMIINGVSEKDLLKRTLLKQNVIGTHIT